MSRRFARPSAWLAPRLVAWLVGSACVAASLRSPAQDATPAPRAWGVIVVGLPGDAEHEPLFAETTKRWGDWLRASRGVADERLFVLSGRPPRPAEAGGTPAEAEVAASPHRPATREALAAVLAEVARQAADRDSLWILTLGHGHDDGRRAWFHAPGPDFDGADLAKWLAPVKCREQVIWATQACSGRWLKPLAKPGRVVISATTAEGEENETEFPHALAAAMQSPLEKSDLNQDRRVSLAELFRAAVRETNARFAADERLPTEHALLDDDADGVGTELEHLFDENAPRPRPGDDAEKPPARPAGSGKDGASAANINVLELPAAASPAPETPATKSPATESPPTKSPVPETRP